MQERASFLRESLVLVDVARVDPHDVRLVAVLRAGSAVEVERLGQDGVRQQRRHHHPHPRSPASSYVRSDVPPRKTLSRPDSGRGWMPVSLSRKYVLVAEALVVERLEEDLDGLLVALAGLGVERDLAFGGSQPCPRPTPNS